MVLVFLDRMMGMGSSDKECVHQDLKEDKDPTAKSILGRGNMM